MKHLLYNVPQLRIEVLEPGEFGSMIKNTHNAHCDVLCAMVSILSKQIIRMVILVRTCVIIMNDVAHEVNSLVKQGQEVSHRHIINLNM